MITRKTKASLLASSVIFASLTAAPAMAQDTPAATEGETILVTGSRIARQNVDTAAPVAVVDSEEFELSGTVNVENVVNSLPQVIPGFTSNSNNPGTGTATLNLRGLGSNRTMVLVNGRRWMFYDTNQTVDLNTIPAFLLDSVEVVTGGASAVYGSDAMAGVVNFNLGHVDGVEVGGQYTISDRGDGQTYELHGAIGTDFADGRGRATVYAEYFNREAVFQGDRDFSSFVVGNESFDDFQGAGGSSTLPQGRFNPSRFVAINRDAEDLDEDGRCDPGEGCALLAQGLVIDDAVFDVPGVARARAGDLYNFGPSNYLQIPQERYLLGGFAEYELFEGATAYTEVSFVNNRVAQELAATPVTGTFNINLAAVAPFLNADTRAQLQTLDARETAAAAAQQAFNTSLGYCGPGQTPPTEDSPTCFGALPGAAPGVVSAFVQRRVTETGSRNTLDERNAFRVLAGLRGDITDYLNYDAYYSYARTRNSNVQAGNISRSAFQAGLDGSGSAINIFGPDTLTPDMVDQISILAQNSDVSTLEVATAYLSGTFGDFAIGNAAPIGFALGGEYRRVASQFIPDTALASGDVIGFNAGSPTEGSYSAKEIFGELNIPVFETDAGMRLDLSAAGRYSDYTLEAVGGVWTYAGGVEFAPFDGLKFRGQYQRAVRAPNVVELFGGQAIGFPGAVDPCGNAAFLAANPGAREICIAHEVPVGNLGNADIIQQGNTQIPALFGGNPNLQEETSDSLSFGVVIQPSMVPGLTITADYFDIVINDTISIAGGSLQGLMNLCYGSVQDVTSPVCTPFDNIRNSDGAITTDAPPLVAGVNIAELGVSGIDLQIDYGLELPFSVFGDGGSSDFNINFLGTWTESSYFIPVVGL